MEVARLVIPAAALLVMAGAFFGVILARITWADEATHAAKIESRYKDIQQTYERIHTQDQETINTMQKTIDMLQHRT